MIQNEEANNENQVTENSISHAEYLSMSENEQKQSSDVEFSHKFSKFEAQFSDAQTCDESGKQTDA